MTSSDSSLSSPPPGVPQRSGGGPYIVATVLLACVIGGLIWYKTSRPAPPTPKPVVPTQTIVNEPTGPIFDIPAPPPLDAAVDAPPEAGKPASKAGPSLCEGPCTANPSASLRSSISATAGGARGCYEQALRTNPSLQGRLVVALRVASNGSVCSTSIVQDTVNSPQVASCVIGRFSGKRFDSFSDGRCVDVQVPVSFTQRENN